jgi:hypothetical protein
VPDVFTGAHRDAIISAAIRNNVPAVYSQSYLPETAASSLTESTR